MVCGDTDEAARVASQIKILVCYSFFSFIFLKTFFIFMNISINV